MQQRNQTSSRDETLSAYLESERRLHGEHSEQSETQAHVEEHFKTTKRPPNVILALIALSLTLSGIAISQPGIRMPITHIASVILSIRHIDDSDSFRKADAANINGIANNTKLPARIRASALTVFPVETKTSDSTGKKREINPSWERMSDISRENPSDMGILALAARKGTQGSFRIDRPELENIASPSIDSKGVPLQVTPLREITHPDAIARMRADCARGEKLDPENAFWPLMMASVHLSAHEDKEAFDALMRASTKAAWREYVQDEIGMHRAYAKFRFGDQGYLGELVRQTSILFPHYASLRGLSRALVGHAILLEQAGRTQDALKIRTALRKVSLKMSLESTSDIGSLVGIAMHSISTSRVKGIPPLKVKAGDAGQAEAARKAVALGNMQRYLDHARAVGQLDEATSAMQDFKRLTDDRERLTWGTERDWEILFKKIQSSLVGAGGSLAIAMNIAWLIVLGGVAGIVIRVSPIGRGGRLAPGVTLMLIGTSAVVLWGVSAFVIGTFATPHGFISTWGTFMGYAPEPMEDGVESNTQFSAGLLSAVGTLIATALPMLVMLGGVIGGAINRRASFSRSIVFAFRGAGLVAIIIGVPAVLGLMVAAGRNDISLMQEQRQEWTGGLEERIAKKAAVKPDANRSASADE